MNNLDCTLCHGTGHVIPAFGFGPPEPCPGCRDRLTLIESRHLEAGAPDADKTWLIAEVKRLRQVPGQIAAAGGTCADSRCSICHDDARAALDEALNIGDGRYRVGGKYEAESIAHARRISASPDLLRAAKAIVASGDMIAAANALEMLLAAIAKAEKRT